MPIPEELLYRQPQSMDEAELIRVMQRQAMRSPAAQIDLYNSVQRPPSNNPVSFAPSRNPAGQTFQDKVKNSMASSLGLSSPEPEKKTSTTVSASGSPQMIQQFLDPTVQRYQAARSMVGQLGQRGIQGLEAGFEVQSPEERALQEEILTNMSGPQGDIGDMRKGIEDASNNADTLRQLKHQTDLSGLAALTDAWTGSNFAKSYTPPESPSDLEYKKAIVEQMLQKSRGELTAEEIKALATLNEGQKGKISIVQKDDEKQQKLKAKIDEEIKKDIEKPMEAINQEYSNIEKLITPDKNGKVSYDRINSIVTQFGKTINKETGNMSNQDAARQIADSFEKDKAQFLSYFQPGQQYVPSDVVKHWRAIAAIGKQTHIQQLKNELDQRAGALSLTYPQLFGPESYGEKRLLLAANRLQGLQPEGIEAPVKPAPKAAPRKADPNAAFNAKMQNAFQQFKAQQKKAQ